MANSSDLNRVDAGELREYIATMVRDEGWKEFRDEEADADTPAIVEARHLDIISQP